MLRAVLASFLCLSIACGASAQELEVAPPQRQSPEWTWALLGTGGAMVLVGLGTGVGALMVQSDLDRVCSRTCPRSYGGVQETGRALAITTDVLWLSGIVVAGFGLVAALTLEDEVPAVSAGCDAHGCHVGLRGRF